MLSNLNSFIKLKPAFAVGFLFAISSLTFGSFVAAIPSIKEKFHFTDATLGLSLLLGPAGALTGVVIANQLFKRVSVGQWMLYGYSLSCFFAMAIIAAPTKMLFGIALYCSGVVNFLNGVSANTTVPFLEKKYDRLMMSTCHAFYSLGGGLSAGLAFLFFRMHLQPIHLILFVSALVWVVQFFNRRYLVQHNEPIHSERSFTLPNKSVLGIAFICMVIFMSEGCVADWSGIYLKEILHAPKYLLSLGYGCFAVAMTIGRFNGDQIIAKWGAQKTVHYCACTALAGFMLVVFVPFIFTALLGYTLIGLGCSCIVPVLFSASATIPNVSKVEGFSMVTTGGLIGILAGPSIIGILSEYSSLNRALLLLVGLLLLVIWVSMRSSILRKS